MFSSVYHVLEVPHFNSIWEQTNLCLMIVIFFKYILKYCYMIEQNGTQVSQTKHILI